MTATPFSQPSTLPHGLPPFAEIRDEHFAPAFEEGMAEQRAEVANITRVRSMPTFENTMEPLERSGRILDRALHVFFNKSSSDSNDTTNALEEEYAPRFAAHSDAIRLDSQLYWRVSTLWEGRESADWTPEQRYLVERWHTEMTLAGAGLDDEAKTKLSELNARLSTLTTRFEKNLLADTNELAVVIRDRAELDGLGEGEIASAAEAARERGIEDAWLVTLPLFTGHPWLAALTDRDVRERIMTASRSRGIRGGEHDNREVLLEIVRLRAERAELLGFASHAAAVTADQTAKTPEAVAGMLERLAPAAARNARAEQEALEKQSGQPIAAHDWALFTEKVRAAEYDVDTAALRPWFEAERVLRDGVFFAAGQVYGLSFEERPELQAYHPEARVFEVFEEDGSALGLYVLDLYTRDSKRGGAWMNPLISQSELLGIPTSIVVNNLNVPKPPAGSPTLLTLDEVNTLFHEFGHALHGLLAHVTYPRFSGTNVYRDFVEFPSQVNEMWMLWPEVLANYAKHVETGEPLDQAIVDRLHASEQFNEGFATSEYLAAALLDQAWHRLSAAEAASITDVADFEARALAAVGLDNPAVPTRYSSTYFAHTFSGGYDAGYYSYIWSEVLDADAVEWFRESGGMTRANGDRFREFVLGIGGSRDPLESYREFRGRPADLSPLLKRRGLE
ncbi:M3 family metallopeptidase [Schumannella soli]|uniref:M3 family metallopeptidase n=1 Tax=Schumannella soli TaxID=2590779 RepID=A0A506XPC8_9MICO|nr:M3 family metallopeptidase [Schumannella soli]TPW74544.1 M3 family metallopeptidase [Schumannella soli]